jgi:hypothetical protein
MEKIKISDDMRKQFRADFPKSAYQGHPTKKFLTTLKAMYVTERLNSVLGVGRWSINVDVIERTDDYVLVQGELICLDYEVIVPKQFGGHKTTGVNTETADGFKSALTDCQSKIASYLEIGIDMFKGHINNKGINTNRETPPKSELTPEKKDVWDAAVKYLQGEGTIDKIKAKYTLSEANEKLIKDATI